MASQADYGFWYQPSSPYVAKTTGRVHVQVCTMSPECAKFAFGAGDDARDNVNVTDAVIDCKRKTVVWSDFMELSHTYRLGGQANGKPFSAEAQLRSGKGDNRKISAKSDLGVLITDLCARRASLNNR